ncbi:MAG: ATP-grasp domain-containing protein [Thermodesulfobacteriota bacterium]
MYLGVDFIINSDLKPFVIEVNIGLPGGAQEYELTHQVILGKTSNIFSKIEEISLKVYGQSFKEYLHSLPFVESLKPFKIWMDGQGPLPRKFHPGLRFEDKWVQFQLLNSIVPMPETIVFDPKNFLEAEAFLKKKEKVVLKRRLGRGGRNFKILSDLDYLAQMNIENRFYLLQEYIESKVEGYVFSIRAVAFGGECICMYANLAHREYSNHGILTFVSKGERIGLEDPKFKTTYFNQKSWEAEIWFGEDYPPYLKHNLFEDEVAETRFILPANLYQTIENLSVKIERYYESLNLLSLPKSCFEL